MAEGFTFNFTNPTSTQQSATVFESKEVLIAAGVEEGVGVLLDQIEVLGSFSPQYAIYIPYKNAFIFLGDSGTQVKAAFYFIDSGNFSPIVDINPTGTSFLRATPVAVSGLVDNNGDTGQGAWLSVSLAGFGRQVLIRFDSNETDDPIVEVTSNTSALSQAIPSPTIWLPQDNRGWIVTQTGFNSNIAYIENVAAPIGSSIRSAALVSLGNPSGVYPKQIKVDTLNQRLILVNNSNTRCFQVVDTETFTLEATFNRGEAMDVIYVEHLNQYYLYTSTNGGSTHNLDVFDSNLSFVKTIINPLGGTGSNINKATMTYVFSSKSILFKGTSATNGYAFWRIDTESIGGFENGTIVDASNFDDTFNIFTPDAKFIQRLNSTIGTVIQIIDTSTETISKVIQNTDLTLPVNQFRQAGSFTNQQVCYIGGTGNGIPNNLINIFSGANTLGTSPVAVNTQAGNQTYPEVLQSLQNQDYVITDFYLKTNSVAQANKRIAISYTSPNGETHEDEIFPTINPMQPQVVLKDLKTKFVSNSLNTIQIDILPNETVELIATYETFERNEGEAFPDINTINRILNAPEQNREILKQIWGEGVFTGTTEPSPPSKKKQPIHITLDSPFARVIYKRAKI